MKLAYHWIDNIVFSDTPTEFLSYGNVAGHTLTIMCRARVLEGTRQPVGQRDYPRSKGFVAVCSVNFLCVGHLYVYVLLGYV